MKNKYLDLDFYKSLFESDRVGRRLATAVILFSSAFALVITAVQLYSEYSRDLGRIDSNFQSIESSQLALMTNSVWSLNSQQVQIQLDGLLQFPDVEYASVSVDGIITWSAGQPSSTRNIQRVYSLVHENRGRAQTIGVLEIRASLDNVYARVLDQLVVLLVSNGLKTFFVAIFMLVTFQILVARHLYKIARYTENIDLANGEEKRLVMDRVKAPQGNPDALERVADSINSMQNEMALSYAKLSAARKEAEISNQAKSEFLSAMSHDLRTPLNAIMGFSEIMGKEVYGPLGSDKYAEYVSHIHQSGAYLLQLIEDILDISRLEAGERVIHKEPVELREVSLACYNILRNMADAKDIECRLDIPEAVPPVYADRQSLMQILMNLVSNSIKYTLNGGSIILNGSVLDQHHIIKVSDTGMGIPEEHIEKITEPFNRIKHGDHESQQGTGLGLAIVNSLVKLHNGTLSIESEFGKGTTVTVALPVRP
jgi:signal transduction histidine kinase